MLSGSSLFRAPCILRTPGIGTILVHTVACPSLPAAARRFVSTAPKLNVPAAVPSTDIRTSQGTQIPADGGTKHIIDPSFPESSAFPPPEPTKPALSTKDKPLVWIDCEMTGLDPKKDQILEIAVIVTDGNLTPMDAGLSYTIQTDPQVLENMDEWCRATHGATGLTEQCLNHSHSLTLEQAQLGVLKYIQDRIDRPKLANLAGSSVHMDLRFMVTSFPYVIDYLHYRIVDVSSIFELTRRWYPKQLWVWTQQDKARSSNTNTMHRAMSDIQYSIRQLEWYRKEILTAKPFVSEPVTTPEMPGKWS